MKNLIRRLVLLIGTVCLCFIGVTFLGTSKEAQAASSYSVSTYAQLVDACGRSGSPTITLTADITLTGTVLVKGNIEIIGNGKRITPSGDFTCFEVQTGGKLTISGTTIQRTNHGNIFYVFWGGALVVNGGTYSCGDGTPGVGASVINAEGMVTINGGTFSGSKREFYAVCLFGPYNYVVNGGVFTNSTSGLGTNLNTNTNPSATQSITINGGDFYGNVNNGITVGEPSRSQTGTTMAYINGGSFHGNGLNGVSVCYGNQTANIKNVTIYNNAQTGIYVMGSTVNFVGNSVEKVYVHDNGWTYKSNVLVTMGGSFVGGYGEIYNTGSMTDSLSGVYVSNGTVTMNAGLVIRDHEDGIWLENSGSSGIINGGLISSNVNGILVDAAGCTVNGGEISGNTKGILTWYYSTLGISGGMIVNNTYGIQGEDTSSITIAGTSAGAVRISGNSEYGIWLRNDASLSVSNADIYGGNGYNSQRFGIVSHSSENVTITSGNIYGHVSSGVYIGSGTFNIAGGAIHNNSGTGVYCDGGSGTFSANSYNNSFAGVYVTSGTCSVTGGNLYGNNNGIECDGGTVFSSGGNCYNNRYAGVLVIAGTCNITGGGLSSNDIGLRCTGGITTCYASLYNNVTGGLYVNGGTCNVAGGNIYGNDTAVWCRDTGVVNISRANIYNNAYGLYIYTTGVVNISGDSSGAVNIMGNNVVGLHVRENARATVNNANIYGGNGYNSQGTGIVVLTSQYVTVGSGVSIFGHTSDGIRCSAGTTTSAASVYSNASYGIDVMGGTFNMNGGSVTSNGDYGMYLYGNSNVTVSGGNVSGNGGTYGQVYDDIANFTLTGNYGGRSSVNGYVYLAKNDNYVKTESSSTLIMVRPSTYYSGRVVINTSSTSYAAIQENGTLYPNSGWLMKKSGVNVVLARIPSIWYDGVEITGTLYLPSADGWYNANTVASIGKFTAKDDDKDLTLFVMKYEGQTVASGTKDSNEDMHITYDFKHEGIRTYTLTATDSLGNSVTRTVIVRVDLTPPDIIDVDNTEIDYGQSGEEPTFKWSVVVVDPNVPFVQRGEDELSGVANIALMPYSDQTEIIKRVYDSPHIISATLSDYPDEKGLVIKVIDKAGNAAYKCLLSYDMLDIKVEPFYPR